MATRKATLAAAAASVTAQSPTATPSDAGTSIDITASMCMIEKIVSAFSSTFNSCMDRLLDTLGKKLTTRIECQGGKIFELTKKVDSLEKTCKHLEAANAALQE